MGIARENRIQLLESVALPKAIMRLTIPTVVSQLISMVYNLADAFYIGRLGNPYQIAALALCFPLYMMLTLIGNLFGIGANSVIARALGKKDYYTTKQTSAFSFYCVVFVSLLFALVFYFYLDEALVFFGASSNTLPYARSYLIYTMIIGALPTVLQLYFSHIIRAEGASRQAGCGVMLGGILNIILDPIFIFGMNKGVEGAALATLISNCVSLVYFICICVHTRKDSFLAYNIKHFSLAVSKGVLVNGFPAAMQILFGITSNLVMTRTASAYGDLAITSFGILQKFTTMAVFISNGVGQGVAPLLGYNYSAANYKRIHDASRVVISVDIIFSLLFSGAIIVAPSVFVSIFSSDAATIEMAAHFVRIGIGGVIGTVCMSFFTASFQAFGKWIHSFSMNGIRQIVIYIPAIAIMSNLWGVIGLAASVAVSEMISLLIGALLYMRLVVQIRNQLRTAK